MSIESKKDWKAIQWHYDYIRSLEDVDTCPYRLSEQEVSLLLTILEPVAWKTRWYSDTDTPIDTDWIMALRDNLIAKLNLPPDDCDPTPPIEECCEEYEPNAPWIRYAPNNPFTTPDYTPPGYILPPWYVNPAVPLPGVLPTDAMVNYFSSPDVLNMFSSGFPRFRFYFSGSGELEIEFVQIPQGGTALVWVDDDFTTLEALDMTSIGASDVVSIAFILSLIGIETEAQFVNTTIWEHDIDTAGEHHIDVAFIPNVSITDEVLYGNGGGIRKITLCGLMPILKDEDTEMPAQFRMTDACILQYSNDAGVTWVNVEGWSTYAFDCLAGEDGAPGAPGAPGVDGASPEMRVVGNVVQWRQDDNTPTWTDLYIIPGMQTSGEPATGLEYQNCRLATAYVRDMIENFIIGISYSLEKFGDVLWTPEAVADGLPAFWDYQYIASSDLHEVVETWVDYLWTQETATPGFHEALISELSFPDVLKNIATKLKCSMSADLTICEDDLTAWSGRIDAWYSLEFWWTGWKILANGLTVHLPEVLLSEATARFWSECDVDCDDSPTACDLEPPPVSLTFSHNFLFYLGTGGWFGSTGTSDTRWIYAQGWRPGSYYSGTILNRACMGIRSGLFCNELTKVTVLLNTALFPNGRCSISLVGCESGDFEYNAFIDLVDELTVVEFEIPLGLEYQQIHILVENLSACTVDFENGSPAIIGVVVEGLGSDPF